MNTTLPPSSPSSLSVTASAAVTAAAVVGTNGVAKKSMREGPSKDGSPSSSLERFGSLLFRCMRWGVIHGGLTLIFALWMSTYVIQVVHDDYFLTIIKRAQRTDDDLLHEYTYYERQCNVADLTATTPQEATDLIITPTSSTSTAVDKLMRHGALMIPAILKDEIIHKLRRFVVAKNAAVKGTPAEFPVSQGRNRVSYGIEATEDEAVVEALREIYNHPSLLRILQQVTGDIDPSLTEITAITASYGCTHQGWHSDVKSDGNGVKFGRTYSHSYSLFIPLQDTTERMGPTDLCAGTHYCSDQYIEKICNENKIGVHEVGSARSRNFTNGQREGDGSNNVWMAGDGFLLNQQVWHRGSAHREPGAPDRIVFIVSFIGRPHQQDHVRQLSRGTYFHMKYNMWGHSFSDLKDSTKWMGRPWNLLRCLHLWKPRDRNFGYDLFTSAAMRIANSQLGCEPGDLERLLTVLDRLGFPPFLDGTIDLEHPAAWLIYFRETIHNYIHFFMKLNLVGLSVYVGTVFGIALWKRYSRPAGSSTLKGIQTNDNVFNVLSDGIRPLAKSHGLVLALTVYTLHTIHSSPWARDIASGKTLMRPFPNVTDPVVRSDYPWRIEDKGDHHLERGLTTLPTRLDVLVGTRMNSRTIGSYAAWFDYHPGNSQFREFVNQFGGPSFRRLLRLENEAAVQRMRIGNKSITPAQQSRLIHEAAIEHIERRNARFILQEYSTGEWLVMKQKERDAYVQLMLIAGPSSLYSILKRELEFLLDKYRFGFQLRDYGALKRLSETYIHDLSSMIFAVPADTKKRRVRTRTSGDVTTNPSSRRPSIVLQISSATTTASLPRSRTKLGKWIAPEKSFYLLQEVTYVSEEHGEAADVTIIGLSKTRQPHHGAEYDGMATYDIALYGETSYDYGTVLKGVSGDYLYNNPPLTEGDTVLAKHRGKGDYLRGVATRVFPFGDIHVAYDFGGEEYFVPTSRYGLPLE